MANRKPVGASGAARAKPRSTVSTSTAGDNPHFCFEHADRATKHPWVFAPGPDLAPSVFSQLCDLAKLTWRDIERQQTGGRKRHRKHHDMPIDRISTDAQEDIRKRKLDTVFDGDIFRFRFAGEQRLWGFRRGRVFHVVWWDPEHKVCPSEKRHT